MGIPSVLLQLARNNPKIQQIKRMMNTVRMAQNPQLALNQMMMNNPQLKEVMDIINQNGGDPNRALRTVAEQNGINPKDILDMFKN